MRQASELAAMSAPPWRALPSSPCRASPACLPARPPAQLLPPPGPASPRPAGSGHGSTDYLRVAPRTQDERLAARKAARLSLDTSGGTQGGGGEGGGEGCAGAAQGTGTEGGAQLGLRTCLGCRAEQAGAAAAPRRAAGPSTCASTATPLDASRRTANALLLVRCVHPARPAHPVQHTEGTTTTASCTSWRP